MLKSLQSATIDKSLDGVGTRSSSPPPAAQAHSGQENRKGKRYEGRYREAEESLPRITNMSRSNISNAVREVAGYAHDPTAHHCDVVKKKLSYLKDTRELGITFCIDAPDKPQVFADHSSYAPHSDGRW